ncbi:hypothetical protein B0H17DRAFT_1173628 [Mycena rosella]|uniref:Uncharacterized protein n=1 Tax=Mycena rosella TaxID=1033263 RepID=A0AAD7H354_MYCRO|nr:hypothetical protein B0H17DRAFT_1173628 [Mycena rosella]
MYGWAERSSFISGQNLQYEVVSPSHSRTSGSRTSGDAKENRSRLILDSSGELDERGLRVRSDCPDDQDQDQDPGSATRKTMYLTESLNRKMEGGDERILHQITPFVNCKGSKWGATSARGMCRQKTNCGFDRNLLQPWREPQDAGDGLRQTELFSSELLRCNGMERQDR